MVLVHEPAAPLGFYVEKLWYAEGRQGPQRRERVLPNGRFQLVIDTSGNSERLPAAAIAGMRTRCVVIESPSPRPMLGVLFRPGGARAFFDAAADEFWNLAVPLDLVWRSADALRERLCEQPDPSAQFRVLEAALQRRLLDPRPLHPAVQYGLDEFQRVPHRRSIHEAVKDAGLSRRRFSQLFREQVGLTPKLYSRLARFQQVVGEIASGAAIDWADVALSGGYCDQAHMTHEFREFSGLSPGAYLASERPFRNHVAIDRLRADACAAEAP